MGLGLFIAGNGSAMGSAVIETQWFQSANDLSQSQIL